VPGVSNDSCFSGLKNQLEYDSGIRNPLAHKLLQLKKFHKPSLDILYIKIDQKSGILILSPSKYSILKIAGPGLGWLREKTDLY
jgi:hypothetical protein